MGRTISLPNLLFSLAILVYIVISKLVFDNVYLTSKQVIDEEFHIPQGLAYCNLQFDTWDPKITTLPGLYLVSMVLLAPLDLCLIYWLRFVNLAASVLNIILFYILLSSYNKKEILWKNLFSCINLAIFPPLYFFNHLYYTDTISLTFVLLMFIFYNKGNHLMVSVSGMASILMRQTNVIWLVMLFGRYVLIHAVKNALRKKQKRKIELRISEEDLIDMKKRGSVNLINFNIDELLNISCYSIVLLSFVIFVYLNGGVVVGDKMAHVPAIHVPQIFYFSLFTLIFMWPYFVPKILDFVKVALKRRFTIVVLLVVFSLIVYCNTLVHPYLLADNRHYTFYVWHRMYGKYFFARYAMILCYIFSMYCIWSILYSSQDVSLALVYIPCTIFVLLLQKMIEVRYFFIPYILLRLNMRQICLKQLICEFIFFCVINYLTLNIFFTKNIYWVEYTQPQKLIW